MSKVLCEKGRVLIIVLWNIDFYESWMVLRI